MKVIAQMVLAASFCLSTLSLGAENGDPCNNCDSHTDGDSRSDLAGHAHGDQDDRHESSDSPCQHQQEFHCCCSHTQAISTVNALRWLVPGEWSRIVLPRHEARFDPSVRETFHVPLV